jgi:CheY-like chemotaxis protein/two-component sensor histidine kinase
MTDQEAPNRLIADTAHELRTPLTAMRTQLELVRTNLAASLDDYRAMAGALDRTLVRLERMVSDMLLLATAGRSPLNEEVALGPLLEEAAADLRPLAAAQQVALRLSGEADALVAGDEALLLQVFRNLIENGIRYNQAGGEVVVAVERGARSVVVEVRDTGIGIASDEQARIFERFYRVEGASTRHSGGAGLGLSIVAQIVRQHGGQVRLSSTPGQGSVFRVHLPLLGSGALEPDVDLNSDFIPSVLPSSYAPTGDLQPRRETMARTLLFIDDAPDINSLLVNYFRQAGFDTLGAHDGHTGLDMARAEHPDLIVLDLGLPDIDGIDVCRELRRDSTVPIVMLTRRGELDDRVKGLEAGADYYLVKPFRIEELKAVIDAVLRRSAPPTE